MAPRVRANMNTRMRLRTSGSAAARDKGSGIPAGAATVPSRLDISSLSLFSGETWFPPLHDPLIAEAGTEAADAAAAEEEVFLSPNFLSSSSPTSSSPNPPSSLTVSPAPLGQGRERRPVLSRLRPGELIPPLSLRPRRVPDEGVVGGQKGRGGPSPPSPFDSAAKIGSLRRRLRANVGNGGKIIGRILGAHATRYTPRLRA